MKYVKLNKQIDRLDSNADSVTSNYTYIKAILNVQ